MSTENFAAQAHRRLHDQHRTLHERPVPSPSPWWEGPLVGFDLETTGPDPDTARIVTACILVHDPDHPTDVVRSWNWLVNPGVTIPDEATAVHGITTQRAVEDGQDPTSAIGSIITTLYGFSLPMVAFNAAFDFTVLDREARRHGIQPLDPEPVVDPFVLDKQADRYRRGSRKLVDVSAHYGVDLTDAHTADADALAAVHVARAIGRQHRPPANAHHLHVGQIAWRAEQCESLQDYLRRTKDQKAIVDPTWPVHPYQEAVA